MLLSTISRLRLLSLLLLFPLLLPLVTSLPLTPATLRVTVTSCKDWGDIYAPYWNRFPQCHQGIASKECCETYDLLDKSLRIFQEALSCGVTNGRFFADKFQQWCMGAQSPVPDQGSGTSQSPGTPNVGGAGGGHGNSDGIIILDDGTTQITNNSGQSGSSSGGDTTGGGTGGSTGGGGGTGGSGTGGTTGGGTGGTGCGTTGCGTGCGTTGCSTGCGTTGCGTGCGSTGCSSDCSTGCGTGCGTSCGGVGGGHGDGSTGGCSLCTNCCTCCSQKCCHCSGRSGRSGCSGGIGCGGGTCTPDCHAFNCGECHTCESGGSGGSSGGNSSSGESSGGGTNSAGGGSGSDHVSFEKTCFSGEGVVELKGGIRKRMDEVEIGDLVHVGDGEYSAVIVWTHQSRNEFGRFVVVQADGGAFAMTETHFVYSGRGVLAAKELKVGDVVRRGNGSWADVEKVKREVRKGLYNPQTVQGDIVVDGFVATTYTMATGNWRCGHGLLAPLRWMYRLGLSVK